MRFISTRGGPSVTACEAIVRGIAPDGGLYVPESFPRVSPERVERFASLPFCEVSAEIMGEYLDEFSSGELQAVTRRAYGGNFDDSRVVPLTDISSNESVMELFHGNTIAFKDMALQVLPQLLTASLKKTGEKRRVMILVATSGDTGKAALEGFAGVDKTAITVYYPKDGVSPAQKRQMETQEGENVYVCAVDGNFDDTQRGVKSIFTDGDFAKTLDERGWLLSSANSINWGRLVPQIAYYFWGYAQLLKKGRAAPGEKINFVVPTGNFGNILAGYYAMRMGLPVKKLICASNANNVLTDFFETGVYNRRREFFKTASPSMDILVSSNLERLVYELNWRNAGATAECMKRLAEDGEYDISSQLDGSVIKDEFYAGWCGDADGADTIKRVFTEKKYLLDTHTAIGQNVYEKYVKETGDSAQTILVSTASPYKFASSVLKALGETFEGDDFDAADRLCAVSGV